MTSIIHINLVQIAVAFLLDMIIGDPQWPYHPIRLIGNLIRIMEILIRRLPFSEYVAGIFLTCIVVSITFFSTYLFLFGTRKFSYLCEIVAGILIIYFTISIKCLAREAKKILISLKENNIVTARTSLSRIVGRDTTQLDKEQIIRACIETIAEGSVDGILSPLFYCFLGGPAAAMGYKAVNTLDSMVGYKNQKYSRLGWASARLDDLANYIPARISSILIPIASFFCSYGFKSSFTIAIRDGKKHTSPNSGIPEAAFAGALGVQLGGPNTYQKVIVEKPFIGDNYHRLSLQTVESAIKIMYVTSILAIVCGIGLKAGIRLLLGF